MPHRPESVPPLTPDQVAALLASAAPSEAPEPRAATPSPWTPARAGDPEFEARSRRDTALANELLGCVREVRDLLAAAPLPASTAERAGDAMQRFEHALLELLRYHGT